MSAKKGKLFLLKIYNGSYLTLGGLRSTTMTINKESIDVTSIDSGEWRELLDQAGIRSMDISGSGVWEAGSNTDLVRANCMTGTLTNFQIIDEDGNTYTGSFHINSFERTGEYNGTDAWSVSLASAGEITYAAA